MPRLTESFTTASILAGASLELNRELTTAANRFKIIKLTVTPNTESTSLMKVEIFKRNTFLAADLCYGTDNFNGPLIEPMESKGQGPTERNEGFVAQYEDLDSTLQSFGQSSELHIKIYNNHSAAQTYDVEMIYEPDIIAGLGISVSQAGEIAQQPSSTQQLVEVRVDDVLVGIVPVLNFKSGTRITITGALDSGASWSEPTVEVTVTAANQFVAIEALFWSTNFLN